MAAIAIGVTPSVTDVTPSQTTPRNTPLKGCYGSGPAQVFKASDLTERDRREVTLWRMVGRYDEAIAAGDARGAAILLDGFKRRLADYEEACPA